MREIAVFVLEREVIKPELLSGEGSAQIVGERASFTTNKIENKNVVDYFLP